MYVVRRIAKAQPGKAWQVANLLTKICAAYEEKGRPKAQVYVSQGVPGTPNVAYAEWTQATIEPNWPSKIPEVVRTLNAEMQAQLDSYEIEFYELVTPEKLVERGVS